ncbi:MAG: hypothetical protein RLN89_11355 [Parvibaculum sp.]
MVNETDKQNPGDLADLPVDHKILVEADTLTPEPQAIQFAARMAGALQARLAGCFVENQALMDLAALPFASEVSFGGTVKPFQRERLEREWAAQAKQAETVFAAAAAAAGLAWSFEVRRGKPIFSMLEAAAREDVVVLNPGARLTPAGDLARAVRAATGEIHADVLLTGRGMRGEGGTRRTPDVTARGTLVALDDMTSRGEACCAVAQSLAERAGMNFIPLRTSASSLSDVADLLRQLAPSLVIVDANAAIFAQDDNVARLSTAAGCPVYLLGSERKLTLVSVTP